LKILPRAEWAATQIAVGDRYEIVQLSGADEFLFVAFVGAPFFGGNLPRFRRQSSTYIVALVSCDDAHPLFD